jgi:hypothetical protein
MRAPSYGGAAYIPRAVFLHVGALANHPAVPDPVQSIEAAREGWERWTSLSAPPDRQRVMDRLCPGFTPEALMTEAAAARLRSWFEAGAPRLSRRVVARDATVMGLNSRRREIMAVLYRLPPVVVHHVVRRGWILGCDRSLSGWVTQAPPPPAGDPLQLVVVDGKLTHEDFPRVLAHELAHCWLLAVVPPAQNRPLVERRAQWRRHDLLVANLSRKWNQPNPLVREEARSEYQTAALARSWGFTGHATDADGCAEAARMAAMRGPRAW